MRFDFQKFYDTQDRRKFEIEKNYAAKRVNRKEARSLY
jgi:hypothetical protein